MSLSQRKRPTCEGFPSPCLHGCVGDILLSLHLLISDTTESPTTYLFSNATEAAHPSQTSKQQADTTPRRGPNPLYLVVRKHPLDHVRHRLSFVATRSAPLPLRVLHRLIIGSCNKQQENRKKTQAKRHVGVKTHGKVGAAQT